MELVFLTQEPQPWAEPSAQKEKVPFGGKIPSWDLHLGTFSHNMLSEACLILLGYRISGEDEYSPCSVPCRRVSSWSSFSEQIDCKALSKERMD